VARCAALLGEPACSAKAYADPLKAFRGRQAAQGLSKAAMTARTHRTHKEVDPGTQALIDRIPDDGELEAPCVPKRPNLKTGTVKTKLQAIARYIYSFEYNHTGKNYFKMSRDRGLKHIHFTAREIMREALPIQCVEAVFLAIHLTADLECLDVRLPLSFKSKCDDRHYRHIVLAVRDKETQKWGSLGISRRKALATKDCDFASLSTLVLDFQLSYKACGHELVKLYVGLPFPPGLHSVDPIKWRVLKQVLNVDSTKNIDKYAKDCQWVREYHKSSGVLPEPYNGVGVATKAKLPAAAKNKKKRRRKKKQAPAGEAPAEGAYDPEKYTGADDEAVLGSDSEEESDGESDDAVIEEES